MSKFFNLPAPWNPGYALPQNVTDEGLERHALTTAWAPRGTFDEPEVGSGGYVLPSYVKEEGFGRGTFVTRWAPRGGPQIPHMLDRRSARVVGRTSLPGGATKLKIQTMGAIEEKMTGSAPFTAYGLRAAGALIDTVKMMPPSLRTEQLKKAMDKIDPKLYSRAEEAAKLETKAGVPADVALERGIAVAMSYGIASELVDLGKGKGTQRKSQLGGCLPCAAAMLGDDPVRAGYCWIPATTTVPGHWERAPASGCGAGTATTLATPRTGGGGGVTVTDTATGQVVKTTLGTPPTAPSNQKFLNIGPFLIPVTAGAWRDHRPLPAEQRAFVDQNIAIAAKAGGVSVAEMKTGKYPFVRFEANGEQWGLFYTESDGTLKTSRGTTIPAGTTVAYHKIASTQSGVGGYAGLGWSITGAVSDIGGAIKDAAEYVGGAIASVFKKIWAGIKWVAAKVVDFVKDAVKWIGDKACDLFTSPLGQVAGAAAGAAVGGPAGAQAGAMGAQIAAQACSSSPSTDQTPPPPPPPEKSNLMPVLLIGGAGVAAFFLLRKKK
jgi:hypothetical protein